MISSIGKFKNSRKNLEKALIIPNLDSLICSLYTLSGSHEVFEKLNLRKDLDRLAFIAEKIAEKFKRKPRSCCC